MKGLMVQIYRSGKYDCTASGVTSGTIEHAVLTGPGVPEIFEPREGMPELHLEIELDPVGVRAGYLAVAKTEYLAAIGAPRKIGDSAPRVVRVKAVPANHDGRWVMFGGNFIRSCDSRFPVEGCIPVFDRIEA